MLYRFGNGTICSAALLVFILIYFIVSSDGSADLAKRDGFFFAPPELHSKFCGKDVFIAASSALLRGAERHLA
jgi:hypothetical protein